MHCRWNADQNASHVAIFHAERSFISLNSEWRTCGRYDSSGTTATVAVWLDGTLKVANVGDTHAVLCRNSQGALQEYCTFVWSTHVPHMPCAVHIPIIMSVMLKAMALPSAVITAVPHLSSYKC